MDREVRDSPQGTPIGLLPDALLGIVGPGVDVGREIADAVDLIPRRPKRCLAEGSQVRPTVRRAFEAMIKDTHRVHVLK